MMCHKKDQQKRERIDPKSWNNIKTLNASSYAGPESGKRQQHNNTKSKVMKKMKAFSCTYSLFGQTQHK